MGQRNVFVQTETAYSINRQTGRGSGAFRGEPERRLEPVAESITKYFMMLRNCNNS